MELDAKYTWRARGGAWGLRLYTVQSGWIFGDSELACLLKEVAPGGLIVPVQGLLVHAVCSAALSMAAGYR